MLFSIYLLSHSARWLFRKFSVSVLLYSFSFLFLYIFGFSFFILFLLYFLFLSFFFSFFGRLLEQRGLSYAQLCASSIVLARTPCRDRTDHAPLGVCDLIFPTFFLSFLFFPFLSFSAPCSYADLSLHSSFVSFHCWIVFVLFRVLVIRLDCFFFFWFA